MTPMHVFLCLTMLYLFNSLVQRKLLNVLMKIVNIGSASIVVGTHCPIQCVKNLRALHHLYFISPPKYASASRVSRGAHQKARQPIMRCPDPS